MTEIIPSVIVRCPGCGDDRRSSVRNARRIASGEQSGLCGWCRNPNRRHPARLPKGPDLSSPYHEFWRKKFSQKEIDELWQSVSLYLDDLKGVAA